MKLKPNTNHYLFYDSSATLTYIISLDMSVYTKTENIINNQKNHKKKKTFIIHSRADKVMTH